jgi:hypothetical protein
MLCHPTKQIYINKKLLVKRILKKWSWKQFLKSYCLKAIEGFLGNFLRGMCIYTFVIEFMYMLKFENEISSWNAKSKCLCSLSNSLWESFHLSLMWISNYGTFLGESLVQSSKTKIWINAIVLTIGATFTKMLFCLGFHN